MKKIVKTFIILAFFIILCSCNNKKEKVDSNLITTDSAQVREMCKHVKMNNALFNCIQTYINEHLVMEPKRDWMYYNLLFFEENGNQYFTIWFFVTFPDCIVSQKLDTTKYDYYMDYVRDRKVVFVISKGSKSEIFNPNGESKKIAKEEQFKKRTPPSYDGSFYYQTYLIKKNKNEVELTELDSANIFFNPYNGSKKIPGDGKDRKIFKN